MMLRWDRDTAVPSRDGIAKAGEACNKLRLWSAAVLCRFLAGMPGDVASFEDPCLSSLIVWLLYEKAAGDSPLPLS